MVGLVALIAGPAMGSEVVVGLERVASGAAPFLDGKRIGVVAHAASVTADGRHAIDVLRGVPGLDVRRIFAPEHGLRGRAAAGETVKSGLDPATGLPVISLYGTRKQPSMADLADLDALVFDLQGAGVRFYTYVSTLLLCLDAAAAAGIDFVVLDRPNPLGGERIEGPLAAPRETVPVSFVNRAPGPLVHGLTLGEMARHANGGRAHPARLQVVPMTGWRRSMTWAETGRPWVAPSPNLRSPEAALAYPGTALLEATNVSEGRGTASPFLIFGAPWLDPARLDIAVPGFRLESTSFTPTSSPAAPHPKHQGEVCRGFKVHVDDAQRAEPYRLGITLLRAVSKQSGFGWKRDGGALTWLIGTPEPYRALRAGKSIDEIVRSDAADHAAWRIARQAALLY